jgi:alpha-tubulin suppressor-like RCC1 family protein
MNCMCRNSWNLLRRVSLLACAVLLTASCDEEVPIGAPPMVAVTIGDTHSCSLSESGAAYCWGNGTVGQLGNGKLERRPYATRVRSDQSFASIDAGSQHTCALTVQGAAYCWGSNANGQLGTGNQRNESEPQAIDSPERFVSISAGEAHSCAVTVDGRAFCWGRGTNGELGAGSLVNAATSPTQVAGSLRFSQISAGWRHTCAVATNGAAYCWGANEMAQLGIGSAGTLELQPTRVDANFAFREVSAGFNHTCGVTPDFAGYCWGENRAGETGNGWVFRAGQAAELRPARVFDYGTIRYTSISAGTSYSCGRWTNGEVYCWGRGDYGQLGIGTLDNHIQPQMVIPEPPLINTVLFADVEASGSTHTCGLGHNGFVFCWGRGDDGQLGSGVPMSMIPTRVATTSSD